MVVVFSVLPVPASAGWCGLGRGRRGGGCAGAFAGGIRRGVGAVAHTALQGRDPPGQRIDPGGGGIRSLLSGLGHRLCLLQTRFGPIDECIGIPYVQLRGGQLVPALGGDGGRVRASPEALRLGVEHLDEHLHIGEVVEPGGAGDEACVVTTETLPQEQERAGQQSTGRLVAVEDTAQGGDTGAEALQSRQSGELREPGTDRFEDLQELAPRPIGLHGGLGPVLRIVLQLPANRVNLFRLRGAVGKEGVRKGRQIAEGGLGGRDRVGEVAAPPIALRRGADPDVLQRIAEPAIVPRALHRREVLGLGFEARQARAELEERAGPGVCLLEHLAEIHRALLDALKRA